PPPVRQPRRPCGRHRGDGGRSGPAMPRSELRRPGPAARPHRLAGCGAVSRLHYRRLRCAPRLRHELARQARLPSGDRDPGNVVRQNLPRLVREQPAGFGAVSDRPGDGVADRSIPLPNQRRRTQMTASSTSSLVLLEFDDHGDRGRVARVTFNNPEKRNALGLAGKDRLVEIMTSLRHDESLRAVVITGSGDRSFVGGTDLAEMAEFDLAAAEASATKTHRVCDSVRQMPVPVIARINGYCFGSGMEIAACADMRVAADHA